MNSKNRVLPSIEDLDDTAFNPFFGDTLAFGDLPDPYPRIAELAQESWVHKGSYRSFFMDTPNAALAGYEFDHYTVFGYDACSAIMMDGITFSSAPQKLTIGTSFGRTISAMDPPEHTRYRRIFQKAFLPHVVRKWGDDLVSPVINGLLDNVINSGRADLVGDFTLHYPFEIIYRQLRLPPEDIKIFHKLAISQTSYIIAPQIAVEAGQKLGAYFTEMVRRRREDPGDDLVSSLALAEVDGEVLPEDVLVSFLRQLTNAGGDTTYRGTSCLLAALLCHPDQLDAVRQDRSLIAAAIDEALRWECPVIHAVRQATRDVEINGFTIPAGAMIDAVTGSANRDPTKFPEPEKFNIFRERANRHLAFITGPHVCIGQHLARVEMERALNAILDRLGNVCLDPDMPPPQIRGFDMRVPEHLHVTFD